MTLPGNHRNQFQRAVALLCALLMVAQLYWNTSFSALAQDPPKSEDKKDPVDAPKPAPADPDTTGKAADPAKDDKAKPDAKKATPDEVEVSFQGANIDMVVQWLAQTTGKSVVKSSKVQCQLSIMSSKKISQREAVTLVYRALAVEGFVAIESAKSILIVPEGQEPKLSPELVDSSKSDMPVGRQKLMKIFPLKFIQANDAKEKIKGLLSEKATADVDDRANQLIITDYTENIRSAGELIAALDTDKPVDLAVRVLPLKHVNAQDLVKDVGPLYQKVSGKAVKEVVEVSANDRSNSLIILSSEANYRAIEKFVAELDTEEASEKIMQAFTLKNADAADVAKQLKDLTQNGDDQRYQYYYYGGSQNNRNNKKMSVVSDRRRNTIIVQAPPSAMPGIAKMVEALDEPVSDDSLAPTIYPLKYVSATDIEDVLNELFLKKTQTRNYWNPFGDPEESTTSDHDVGRLYGKVRITSEPYSNAIILSSNSKENLAAVEEVLKQLDVPSQAGESTFRIGLRFAKASTLANSLNILFAKNGSPALRGGNPQQPQNNPAQNQQNQSSQTASTQSSGFDLEQETKEEGYFPWLGGQPDNTRGSDGKSNARPVSDLVGRVRVVSDQRSNSLLISANVHFFPQVLKLIEDLDAPTAQVLIDARIVEVSSDFMENLGVRWSPNGSQVFTAQDYDNSFLASTTGTYNKGFGGTTVVNSTTPASSLSPGAVASALTSLRSGVLSSTISMDFLVQFLKTTTGATVLDNPQISIEDNETGKLFVGQQVPVPDNNQISSVGSQNTSIKYKDVGVVLEVTPHINTSGDVSLKIHAESSSVVPGQTVLGGAVFDTRNFKTDLTARNGQTLVLGGIIQKQVSDTLRKTPILGSLPGIKWLFNKKDKTVKEVELIVFLRPRVVRSPEDAQELLRETNKRTPLLKDYQDGVEKEKQKRSGKPKDKDMPDEN